MTTIYIVTDGDYNFSTCVSIHLTHKEAMKSFKDYIFKHKENNASITEKQIKL